MAVGESHLQNNLSYNLSKAIYFGEFIWNICIYIYVLFKSYHYLHKKILLIASYMRILFEFVLAMFYSLWFKAIQKLCCMNKTIEVIRNNSRIIIMKRVLPNSHPYRHRLDADAFIFVQKLIQVWILPLNAWKMKFIGSQNAITLVNNKTMISNKPRLISSWPRLQGRLLY